MNLLATQLARWKLPFRPLIGAEIEFYVTTVNGEPEMGFLAIEGSHNDSLIAETGLGQYEYRVGPSTPNAVAEAIIAFKARLSSLTTHNINFSAKPFAEQPGSGLHLHCSLLDENGTNAFAVPGIIEENRLLQQALAGLLHTMPGVMHYYCPSEACYLRFNSPDIHTPTTLTWGGNNRSTALRIPEDLIQNRRIELRIASPMADPYAAIASLLYGIEQGILQELTPPARIYGVAKPNSQIPSLATSLEQAKVVATFLPGSEPYSQ